jgi:phosphoglycerate kinase
MVQKEKFAAAAAGARRQGSQNQTVMATVNQARGKNMQTIKNINTKGKRVLIRVDFNVPLNEKQQVQDDTRIKAVLPTLQYALDQGAKLILASHLGRPKGRRVPELSLTPVAERLGQLLGRAVAMAPDCIGTDVQQLTAAMGPGEVVLLENLRYHPEETNNDSGFAQALAALCDVYVNDAFAVSHRANASVEAVVAHAPQAAAGLLLEKELTYVGQAIASPARPLGAIIGGAKISSKLKALQNIVARVDKLLIGGAMANTFLKSTGLQIGKSHAEDELQAEAAGLIQEAHRRGVRLYLPLDVVVAPDLDPQAPTKIVTAQEIPAQWMALDIGPATARLYDVAMDDLKTVVWNGPMGVFEMDAFSRGTLAVAHSVGAVHALTIVGGGDTDAALHKAGETENISYISTGGGAFLAMLEGATLPAVAALEKVCAAGRPS